ncbi:MAG: hypothetical protein ACPGJS_09635 [Flammeovirgaceae bacterium]
MHDSLHINAQNTKLPELERKLRSPVAYTLETKLALIDELHESHQVDESLLKQLEQDIAEEMQEIQDLKYLRYLGYKHTDSDGYLSISRIGRAIFMDVLGIILGFLLLFMGIGGIMTVVGVSMDPETQLEAGMMMMGFAAFCLLVIGFVLFLKSFNRLMDHTSFSIKKEHSIIRLQKRNDNMKLEQIEVDNSAVQLMESGEKMWVEIGAAKVFEVDNPSFYTQKTLEVITQKLRA